jgi:1-deoxy-D-xylulose-5-phosphate reductoisomerase
VGGVPPDGARGLTPLVVLGATGSIGRQTLEVASRLGLPVTAIAARRTSPELLALAREWPDAEVVATAPDGDADRLVAALGTRLALGEEALLDVAGRPRHVVVNGIVGAEGLAPSVAAVRCGNRLALANKESLVAGGPVLLDAAQAGGAEIVPVDSEHSALWQCLVGEPAGSVRRLLLTASGGPFRGRVRQELAGVGVDEALAHPTWNMGRRISIDSATMMNKALEVIEAHLLFGVDYDSIDVVVHPQSIIHSMIEFIDGSVKAQLGEPDMRVPIQYAVTEPGRREAPVAPLDLAGRSLTFETPDVDAFPCLALGYAAGRRGGVAPIVLNAADEVAVAAFLEGEIGFLDIAEVVAAALASTPDAEPVTVDDVLAADRDARELATSIIADRRP